MIRDTSRRADAPFHDNEIFRKINRHQDSAERQMTTTTSIITDMENISGKVEDTSGTSCGRVVDDVIIISYNY